MPQRAATEKCVKRPAARAAEIVTLTATDGGPRLLYRTVVYGQNVQANSVNVMYKQFVSSHEKIATNASNVPARPQTACMGLH